MLKAKPIEQKTFSVYLFGITKAKEKVSPVVDLAVKIRSGKVIMIKAAVILQIIHIESNADSPRKVKKNPEDYPLADTLPKSVKTYTYGFLIGNNYYNVIILDERKKTQDNLYVII